MKFWRETPANRWERWQISLTERARDFRFACGLTVLLAAGFPRLAHAQKAPELGYVFPPGVAAGSGSDVRLGGFDFTPDLEFFAENPQLRIIPLGPPGDFLIPKPPYWFGPKASTAATPIAREIPAQLVVPENFPEGLVRWQVANANGPSGMSTFYVSHGREIVEQRSRDFPQRLDHLPVAVSGRISKIAEVDRYEFTAERDDWVSVELFARRLGADFHGVIEVRDASGALVDDAAGTEGLDGELCFSVQKSATYQLRLYDADFRGDPAHVYRLALTTGPRVAFTVPAHGQRGTTREVEIFGFGFGPPGGKPKLESVRQTVSFPAEVEAESFSFPCEIAGTVVNVTLPLSNVTELTEAQVRSVEDDTADVLPLDAPCAISRTMRAAASAAGPDEPPSGASEHRYTWQCQPQEWWSVHAASRSIGGDLDPAVTIYGPDGKVVAENDDSGGLSDAGLDLQTTGGTYTCVVRDLSGSIARKADVYRLRLERQAPGFALTVAQQVAVPLGGRAELAVQAVRFAGFAADIRLAVDGLPEGVRTAGDLLIPAGKNESKISFECGADAAVSAAPIRIRGIAPSDTGEWVRAATAPAGGNLGPRTAAEQTTSTILVAVTMTPPFEVLLVDRNRQRDVNRGSTYPAEFRLVRKPDFAGEIQLQMAARQSRHCQGNCGPVMTVPAAAETALYPCFMPEWLETDLTRRMTVMGVAAVSDPRGNRRYLTKLADANVTMIMEGALLKLAPQRGDCVLDPGASVQIPVTISRSPSLCTPVKIELVVPDEIRGLVRAAPLTISPDQSTSILRIETDSDPHLAGPWSLSMRATALADGKWPVVSEAAVTLVFE